MGSVIIELGEKTSFIHFYRSQLLLVLAIVLVHFQNLLLVNLLLAVTLMSTDSGLLS